MKDTERDVRRDGGRSERKLHDSGDQRDGRMADHVSCTRSMVYATGNRWAIENFDATH